MSELRSTTTIECIVNGRQETLQQGSTVSDLLAQLQLQQRSALAVELNAEIVPKSSFATYVLKPNDVLEIVTLVGGG